ncbi:Hypothetical protein NocV09_14400010, partial [Nannochloropsis oceanica]
MDPAELQHVLQHTFSSVQATRAAAEAMIVQLRTRPRFYTSLLQTVSDPACPRECRQAGCIILKNAIKTQWTSAEEAKVKGQPAPPEAVKEEDKPSLREGALAGLLQEADPLIRSLFAECVYHLALTDYPEHWPQLVDERKRWPWWKAKKWAACIAVRFFDRYGVPRLAGDSAQAKAFAKTFYDIVAPVLLQPMLNLMCLRSQGRFVTDRVLHLTLRYAKTSIEMAPTYQVLKPHLDILLFQVAFPLLQQKEDSLVQFQEDPQEYIRKMLGAGDLEDICYDPKDEALSLLTAAVEKRGKTALPRILAYIVQVLDAYNQQADPALKDYK